MIGTEAISGRDRAKSVLGVAIFHALLGYAFIAGLGFSLPVAVNDRLKIFDIVEPPPPPAEEPPRPAARTKTAQGAAAPENVKSRAAPIVAPPPKIVMETPPPVVAAPVAGPGANISAGASDRPGPGTGSGGSGTGTGSGGSGTGGGGGIATRARLVSGRLVPEDYPRAAWRAGTGGTVIVRFIAGTDGRVRGCAVVRSSGNPELDATTCRLITLRFRYDPARDAEGRPVEADLGWKQVWWTERR